MYKFFCVIFLLFLSPVGIAQEITETNSDILFERALEAYKEKEFLKALELTKHGLEIAPEYHDIRILQIRVYWALDNFEAADEQMDYLLKNAPGYVDVKPMVYQRINRFKEPAEALRFIDRVQNIYPGDTGLRVKKAQFLLQDKQRKKARNLAMELISRDDLSGPNRYILQTVLNRSVSDEIGLNYQYINFSDIYLRDDEWHITSAEYQHNFNRTAVIGRINYTDRGHDSGTLYELEAYPVFSERLYAFTNIGVSGGSIFADFRSSLSVFYNFANKFEAEAGGRVQVFSGTSFYTGIAGITTYQGKFLINFRAFIGPERLGQLAQNYQGNLRYYFRAADNYLFLRLGSGISPDEQSRFTRILENPTLDVYYTNLGVNKTLGVHHLLQLSAGVIYEELENNESGSQFIGAVSYRYRF